MAVDLFAWASSQPVWLQVVIGLTLFFVGLPLAGLSAYLLLRFIAVVIDALLPTIRDLGAVVFKVSVVSAVVLAAWLLAGQAAAVISFALGDYLSLPPKQLDQLGIWTGGFKSEAQHAVQ